jgi:hypothetical protein
VNTSNQLRNRIPMRSCGYSNFNPNKYPQSWLIGRICCCSVCSMNVHKRCKENVANTCGINPRHMADILQEMVSRRPVITQ